MLGSWVVDVDGKRRKKFEKGRSRIFMDFGASWLAQINHVRLARSGKREPAKHAAVQPIKVR